MNTQSGERIRGWTLAAIAFLLLSALVIVMASRGSLISGFVNSAIRINSDVDAGELAELAVEFEVAPEISDAQLRAIVANVLERAKSGDPGAALIALEIASRQRRSE